MKTISSQLEAHLQQEVTTICTCWEVKRRDGTFLYFTDHDRDIVYLGNRYLSKYGYKRTNISNTSSLDVDNLDIDGFLNSDAISTQDVRNGLYDYAEVKIFAVNWKDLSMGDIKLRRGFLGEVVLTDSGKFKAELRSITQSLAQNTLQIYQPTCRADVGDSRCKFPIDPPVRQNEMVLSLGQFIKVETGVAHPLGDYRNYEERVYEVITAGTTDLTQPTYDIALDALTTDGTAVLRSVQARTRTGSVTNVSSKSQFNITMLFDLDSDNEDWFNGGVIEFITGLNTGRALEVKDYSGVPNYLIDTYLPFFYEIEVGDVFKVYPGCDKKTVTCASKFAILNSINFPIGRGNIYNFRGEPHIPPSDKLTQTE